MSAAETILVTGATGFTGGHLARALRRRGYRVRALVRSRDLARYLVGEGIELCDGDVVDAADVDRAMTGVSHVYHMAAVYREARHPDRLYRQVNVGGTANVLAAAARHGAARVVHCSTVGVHGDIGSVPADENAPFRPGDIYQQTKLEGELLARRAFDRGLPGTIVRPVGIYGPGDLRFLKLFKTIQAGRFRMFGGGHVFYHLTFIDDLVRGLMLCGEAPAAVGQTYILAGPEYTTVNELGSLVADALGRPRPTRHLPLWPLRAAAVACEMVCKPLGVEPPLHRRRIDFFVKDRAFRTDKARAELGFSPAVSLREGLARTARWYADAGYLERPRRWPGPSPKDTVSVPAGEATR